MKNKNISEGSSGDSLSSSQAVPFSERVFGYLIGPALTYLGISAVSGNYLIQFYTDVLGVSGFVITMMPFLSKILVSAANVLLGRVLDRTSRPSGKARPWLIPSGILLALSGALLYAVPRSDAKLQVLWIIISYNLYFALSHNLYLLAHNLLYTRSSRDVHERDKLSILKNIAEAMLPGALSAVIMPGLISRFGVGALAQSRWFRFMLYISLLAVPASAVEYFFTRERVTDSVTQTGPGFKTQLRDMLGNRKLAAVLAVLLLTHLSSALTNSSMIYFSNWVLADSVEAGAIKQVLLNCVGQFLMGPGLFVIWPVVRKLGKLKTMKYGYLFVVLGCLCVLFCSSNLTVVLVGMTIKSVGSLPGYLSMSLLSDCIDEFADEKGYRCDALAVSASAIITSLSSGISQSIILAGTGLLGYIAPESSAQIICQSDGIKLFFSLCFAGAAALSAGISYFLIGRCIKE